MLNVECRFAIARGKRKNAGPAVRGAGILETFTLQQKGKRLLTGLAIGQAIATGKVRRLRNAAERSRFEDGAILVTAMTDPDWVPIMKRAAAIVTDHGGRTSHAAIVSREMGLPAIVGTGKATRVLEDGPGALRVAERRAEGREVRNVAASGALEAAGR